MQTPVNPNSRTAQVRAAASQLQNLENNRDVLFARLGKLVTEDGLKPQLDDFGQRFQLAENAPLPNMRGELWERNEVERQRAETFIRLVNEAQVSLNLLLQDLEERLGDSPAVKDLLEIEESFEKPRNELRFRMKPVDTDTLDAVNAFDLVLDAFREDWRAEREKLEKMESVPEEWMDKVRELDALWAVVKKGIGDDETVEEGELVSSGA